MVGTSVPTTSNFTLFIHTLSDLSNKTPKKIPVASDGMSGRTWEACRPIVPLIGLSTMLSKATLRNEEQPHRWAAP